MRLRNTVLAVLCLASVCGAQSQSPPVADAIVDLRTDGGASMVHATWRFAEAAIVESTNPRAGPDHRPQGAAVATHDIQPRFGTPEFAASEWQAISPSSLETRRTAGKLSFAWYVVTLTIPASIGAFQTAGSTVVLEATFDDYAEVWVPGMPAVVLGQASGGAISGWNAPQRVVLARDAHPGQQFEVAIFAANGPLAAPPGNYIWIRSATLDFYRAGRDPTSVSEPVSTAVTRIDPAIDTIIAPGTKAERIATGFVFTEGPVWVPEATDSRYGGGGSGGYLLFSDPNKNVIHRWDPRSGQASTFRTKSGYSGLPDEGVNIGEYFQPGSNGLALDREGRLTICEHGNRRVTRLEANGSITVLADRFDARRLNSPNDLVYRSDGTLYFTDPPFGLPKTFGDLHKELPFSGVFCVRNSELRLAASDLEAPNGLAFSPDERMLYVDNWVESRKVVLRYDVADDGTLANPSTFFDMTLSRGEICLDGLKVDTQGNVYVAGPGGIWVLSSDARHLGTISLPELAANFAFGDTDGRTLYICARTSVYRLRLRIPGIDKSGN